MGAPAYKLVPQEDGTQLVVPLRKRPVSRTCPGSGRRVQPTGSTAFPEVRCAECAAYLPPVERYGETFMRSHRRVAS